MSERAIGVGVIGLGFMGGTHVQAYRAAHAAGFANRLVAVCDADPQRRAGHGGAAGNIATGSDERLFDPADVAATDDPAELLANPAVELVSICTPTDSHVELALRALEAKKHVLVEKPVAVSSRAIEELAAAARAASTLCMPAHCIRFWPAWRYAHDAIRAKTYGATRSAVFRRLASMPSWSADFYADPERSGGALFDLHIHDTDFIRATFGEPERVQSTGDPHHVTTLYHFPDGPPHVVAEGGWDHTPGWPFEMTFTIVCERATLDFRIGREPELLLIQDGEARPVELSATTGWDEEIRALLAAIRDGASAPPLTVDDALGTARLLEAERANLGRGS